MTYTFIAISYIEILRCDLKNINIFLEKSDTTKDNYSSDFDQDLPYDLLSRPYYVDSIVFNVDRSPSSDFDSE